MDFDKLVEYQNMMATRLRQEQQVDRKIEVMSIINQLTPGPKNMVQKEQIIVEAESRGLTSEEVDKQLLILEKENIIALSGSYVRKK